VCRNFICGNESANVTNMSEEYWRAIRQMAEWPCCGRWGSSVMEFIFQLGCLLLAWMFDHVNSQFRNAQELTGAWNAGKYLLRRSGNVCIYTHKLKHVLKFSVVPSFSYITFWKLTTENFWKFWSSEGVHFRNLLFFIRWSCFWNLSLFITWCSFLKRCCCFLLFLLLFIRWDLFLRPEQERSISTAQVRLKFEI
jgi:hypothetical protein